MRVYRPSFKYSLLFAHFKVHGNLLLTLLGLCNLSFSQGDQVDFEMTAEGTEKP